MVLFDYSTQFASVNSTHATAGQALRLVLVLNKILAPKNTLPEQNAYTGAPQHLSSISSSQKQDRGTLGTLRVTKRRVREVGPGGDCPSVTSQHLFQIRSHNESMGLDYSNLTAKKTEATQVTFLPQVYTAQNVQRWDSKLGLSDSLADIAIKLLVNTVGIFSGINFPMKFEH